MSQAIIIRPPEGLGDTTDTTAASTGSSLQTIVGWSIVGVGICALAYLLVKGPGDSENPSDDEPRPRRRGKARSLIQKGRNVEFLMKDGGSYRAKGSMMHDPSGRFWPRSSVLCGSISASARKALKEEITGEAEHYLARPPRMAQVNTPSRSLQGWEYLGEVVEIRYTRTGNRKPGRYFHEFSKGTALATLVKGKGRVRLYRSGRWYRLELPRGAILDTRGFVWP